MFHTRKFLQMNRCACGPRWPGLAGNADGKSQVGAQGWQGTRRDYSRDKSPPVGCPISGPKCLCLPENCAMTLEWNTAQFHRGTHT